MNKTDYYTVLELSRNCTLPEVRQSFKKLALKWHPDKCVDKIEAEARFNEIHEAYTILNDDRKKKLYDEYGHEGLRRDEEGNQDPNNNKGKSFFQKGFQGTDKSAFEVLKDILGENDDDYFFQNYNSFGISDTFQSSIKSFIEDNVFCAKEDPENNFFESYRPTFMNPNFMMTPEFPDLGFDNPCTTHVFSFLATNTGDTAYAKSSTTTVFQNGNVSTYTSDLFQGFSSLFESQGTNDNSSERTSADSSENKKYDPLYTPNPRGASYIVIEDETATGANVNYGDNARFFNFENFDKELAKEDDFEQKLNSPSKKINKLKDSLNMRLMNKKPSKKNRS